MDILFIWVLLCIGAGMLANRYNRHVFGWFLLTLCVSPIVGFVWLLALGPANPVHTVPADPQPEAPTRVLSMRHSW
jgi:hypothetical protein